MKKEKLCLDKFSIQKIDAKEMTKAKGGTKYYYGSNQYGEYMYWYEDDGSMHGIYTSFDA